MFQEAESCLDDLHAFWEGEILRLCTSVPMNCFESPAGRKLLITSESAQAVFLINSTTGEAPALVRNLNDSATTSRFQQELGLSGNSRFSMALKFE